ncbi:MAG: hypothetical protein JW993_07460 [Sedimentisphaerales bacterium]|nr:hypothetical protein [Sedimentisphaerales bacterium]
MSSVKDEARKLIERLPSEATWDDVMYELYVKKKLAQALKAADEGRVIAHDKVRASFLAE